MLADEERRVRESVTNRDEEYAPTISIGLEIHLDYDPRPQTSIFTYPPGPDRKWITVAAREPPQVELPAPEFVAPLQSMVLLHFDLSKGFDLKSLGTYLLSLKFTKAGPFDCEAQMPSQILEILP